MGDIKTHRLIYETFIQPRLPPGEDPIYVELGNYLTDVSQFRDPWAHVGGKSTVWERRFPVLGKFLIPDVFGADEYFDLLLGTKDRPHAKLAEWFREVIYIFALEKSFNRGDPRRYLIDPDEFKRLYDRHFTQYYPHEHVDCQPGPTGRLDDLSPSQVGVPGTGGAKRRIIHYLEDHIEGLAELLTVVEQQWARADSLSDRERRDLMVRFGHACHAVEDFFFHSNFVEFADEILRPGEGAKAWDPAELLGEDECVPRADGRIPPPGHLRWDRITFRRKLAPVYQEDGEIHALGTTASASDIVYTAAIPMPDIFHTFFDAIGHHTETAPTAGAATLDIMELVDEINRLCEATSASAAGAAAAGLPLVGRLRNTDPMELLEGLMHKLVPGEEETDPDAATPARRDRAKVHAAYKCLVQRDVLTTLFRLGAARGTVHRTSADAMARACAVEKELWDSLPSWRGGDAAGAAMFMITLLEIGRSEVAKGESATEALDATDAALDATARRSADSHRLSHNGSSAERVGTHSLMSKDSCLKQPLRRQAINGAGFVVSYITKTMVDQMSPATRIAGGVDWAHLLRHFLTHPRQANPSGGEQWWRAALDWDRSEAGRPPEHHELQTLPPPEAAALRAEPKRTALEGRYDVLTAEGHRRFRNTVNTDWVYGSLITGSLTGAILGGIGGWKGWDSKTLFGIVAGAATGAAATGLLSAAGTLIDDEAGSVVGLLTGLAAAGIGSYAVGAAIADA